VGADREKHKDGNNEIAHYFLASILPRLKQNSQFINLPPTPFPRGELASSHALPQLKAHSSHAFASFEEPPPMKEDAESKTQEEPT